ncbi:MAG: single-stranded DNA-binding protein, partial [Bacteroidota bacterium]
MTALATPCFSKSVILTTKKKGNIQMAYNNTAIITGNIGTEAKIIENNGKTFASFSIASTDSYQNEQEEWVKRDTVWHDVLVFSPRLIEQVKAFKKGTRLKVTGSIS